MVHLIKSVNELRQRLNDQPVDYLLHTSLPAEKVNLQFEGVLDGVPVVWNACVRAMDNYRYQHSLCIDREQYINIEIADEYCYLDVGLYFKQIDRAVLAKTIIMVRKYKRLCVGCCFFGAKNKID